MYRQTKGQTDGRTSFTEHKCVLKEMLKKPDEQIHKQKNRKKHIQMYRQTKGQMYGWTSFTEHKCILRELFKSRMNRYTNKKQKDTYTNVQTDKRTDRWTDQF